MTTGLELAALHEAGHAVAAAELGMTLGPIGVLGDGRGCMNYWTHDRLDAATPDTGLPLVTWPLALQQWAAARVVILLAGDVAERLFAPRQGRTTVEPVAEVARDVVAGDRPPAASVAEREMVAAQLADPPVDADEVAHTAWIVHGGDPLRAGLWIAWLAEETRALLIVREARVRRLAALVAAERTVGGEAAARVIADTPC